MWKVALIGTGYWSEKHLKAWTRNPETQIVALANRNNQKLSKKAEEFNISKNHLYNDIDDLLENEEFDILDIVTGPKTHLEFIKKAAAKKKHIMCQKPFASSLEEASEMVNIVEKAGVRLMVTENWRWLQPYQVIKTILDSGSLGQINVARYIHTDYYTPRMAPNVELPQPVFREMPNLLFYEMGTHWFDTWRFLFGEPDRIYAEMKKISPYIAGEDTGIITLGYEDFYGVMDMSWATRRNLANSLGEEVLPEHREQMIIEGDKATLKLYYSGEISITDNRGEEKTIRKTTELDHEESHFRLHSHFISCLNNNEEFQTSATDNIKSLNLVFKAYESAANHQVIHFANK